MRTIRFPLDIEPNESIPGALARGIRINVLERANLFFDDAELPRRKTGLTQVMARPELQKLADFLKCEVKELVARAGTISNLTKRSMLVHFGNLRLDRADIDLTHRRIAPLTLRDRPHHREAWLFSLLPYCPVSLELLVDECSACRCTLSWARCWGIEVCEWCGSTVAASAEPPLAEKFADDYRFFASLLSPQASTRDAAIRSLPSMFHDVAPGSIVTMVLRLGQLCRPDPILGIRRESLSRLDASRLSSVIGLGTAMVRNWPQSIKDWAGAEFAQHQDDLTGHHEVRNRIKRLGNARLEDITQAQMVRAALPLEFESFAYSAASGRFITATQFMSKTSVKQEQLNLIREKLEDRRLPSLERKRSQLNCERVEAFEQRYPTSLRLRRLTFKFMLPTYALEQMIYLDVLPQEEDEAVRVARHGMSVQQRSVDHLVDKIRRHALPTAVPADAIPIDTAARQIGGREKPWGAIFRALRDGHIEFWLSSPNVSSRTILVQPASLARFRDVTFAPTRHRLFPFASTVNSSEAEEILNISYRYLQQMVEDGLLSMSETSGSMIALKCDVLTLAREMVSPAELGFAMNRHPRPAGREAAALGVRRIGCGWSRTDLMQLGLLNQPGCRTGAKIANSHLRHRGGQEGANQLFR